MPIRTKNTVRDAGQRFRPTNPRTAAYAVNERPPEYKVPVPETKIVARGRIESPTLDRELGYFHDVATGKLEPQNDRAVTLVLNFFRATQTHIRPIAERFTVGPAAGAPYYALHASPNTTSMDEYNNLLITRREPISAVYSDACLSVIQPKLNLHGGGNTVMAKMTRGGVEYTLSWGDKVTVGKLGDCYCVWDTRDGSAVAQIFCDEAWQSLDDKPARGIIRVRKAKNLNSGPNELANYEDPRALHVEELAYLDFLKEWPQFVSMNDQAHKSMDVLIAALFTVLVIETRKRDQISELGSLPSYVP